jgi:hypothetical protein
MGFRYGHLVPPGSVFSNRGFPNSDFVKLTNPTAEQAGYVPFAYNNPKYICFAWVKQMYRLSQTRNPVLKTMIPAAGQKLAKLKTWILRRG